MFLIGLDLRWDCGFFPFFPDVYIEHKSHFNPVGQGRVDVVLRVVLSGTSKGAL